MNWSWRTWEIFSNPMLINSSQREKFLSKNFTSSQRKSISRHSIRRPLKEFGISNRIFHKKASTKNCLLPVSWNHFSWFSLIRFELSSLSGIDNNIPIWLGYHQGMLTVQISLPLSHYLSLSVITLGKSSR